jgi:7-carboxy-7-deazaguanine synthase
LHYDKKLPQFFGLFIFYVAMPISLSSTSVSSHVASIKTGAPVQEVFSSTQGEGVYVGKRQVFIRFAHCHLKCAYCDTPMQSHDGACHVEMQPGSGEKISFANPLSTESLVDITCNLLRLLPHHSVSFTGGEPLLYHGFLRHTLPLIRAYAPIYLETSGTQADFFANVSDWVDIVAMDIKLPSATKEAPRFEEHAAFYQLARSKECFIKLVFNDGTTLDELESVRAIVTDSNTPIILQPETCLSNNAVQIHPRRLFEIETTLAAWFTDIRIIPQTHKMLKVL